MFSEENCIGNVTSVKLEVNAIGVVFRNAHGGESSLQKACVHTNVTGICFYHLELVA